MYIYKLYVESCSSNNQCGRHHVLFCVSKLSDGQRYPVKKPNTYIFFFSSDKGQILLPNQNNCCSNE